MCETAYSITERKERSVGDRMLAMLRCVKTSPGCRPRRVVSGTRESEQPSQTESGVREGKGRASEGKMKVKG